MKKITLDNFELTFIKRKKQKNIRLSINNKNQIILSAPLFCTDKTAKDFAIKHLNWIKEKITTSNKLQTFANHDIVTILGTTYKINHNINHPSYVKIIDNEIQIGGEEKFIHRKVSNFTKKELLAYIQKKAFLMAKIINKKPNRISLKSTTSRWGSCSSQNNLNFCWKIGFAPLFVIDYLIAHEVSHLKEMNHSPQFWKTVSLLDVKQAEAEIWLRKNGKTLINIV